MRGGTAGPLPAPALALALALLAGCGGNRAGNADRPGTGGEPAAGPTGSVVETPDTARGVVAVVGADPLTRVVLRAPGGTVEVRGPEASTLRRLAGVEVRVSGERKDGGIDASSFRVRSASGFPAEDGILTVQGDVGILTGPEGERVRHRPIPLALRQLAGQHVWVAGLPGETPEAWGLVRAPH